MINQYPLPEFEFNKASSYDEYALAHSETGCIVTEIGRSSNDKPIFSLEVGDVRKPTIYFEGQIHGRHEWTTAHWTREFMKILANPPESHKPIINRLKGKFHFFCIPCVNPYGYEFETYGNANNINLNRNFDYRFEEFPDDGSFFGTSKGPYAFSEPETQLIKEQVERLKPFMFVDTHTRGDQSIPSFIPGNVDNQRYTVLFRDFVTSLRMSIDIHGTGFLNPVDTPQAGAWAATQISESGNETLAITVEPPELVGHIQQGYQGMNMFLLLSLYAENWYETRQMKCY